jgi:hypothetical protein
MVSTIFTAGRGLALAVALTSGTVPASPVFGQGPQEKTCIAVMLPSVRGVEGSASEASAGLRDLLVSYLSGPSIQALSLEARLPAQAVEEARQKQCPHVVTTTLTRTHSGGRALGKALGQSAGTAAWLMPGGGSVGSAVVRGVAIGGAQAVATMASSTKAKDEMRLEYSIAPADGPARDTPNVEKARARVDREDLVTPLVERAATAIVAAVTKP